MGSLLSYAKKNPDNIITPFGQIDVLLLYAIAADKLKDYLGDREIAGKIWMPSGKVPFLLKRGSKLKPLYANELIEAVDLDFLELRSKEEHLKDAKNDITDLQYKVWQYFLPRKLADFFYATNHENPGGEIDRIFFDLDRFKGMSADQAQETTRIFIETIKEDKEFQNLPLNPEPFIYWTGNSFHVFFFLDKPQPNSFYETYFQYSKNNPEQNFTGKWAKAVNEKTEFKVLGGHERQGNSINIDPSQTPSGKLSRVPLGSLHMEDPKAVDGVSVPITKKMLYDDDLTGKLAEYKPKDVIENLDEFAKYLPEIR
ncbi:hypothetical protein [Methanobacterium sp. ACI-7]|uniref:hypothetical protein n=1 Tax=unclassified Methanobacterium TaxID=2627676 RepID=UPI0039C05508